MFTSNYTITVNKSGERIGILGVGDLHLIKRSFIDNPTLSAGNLRELILFYQIAQMPNVYTLFTGDFFDDDRTTVRLRKKESRYDGRQMDAQTEKELKCRLTDDDISDMDFWDRRLIPSLKKIAPRSIGMIKGNHYRVYGNEQSNVGYICQRSGIKLLGEHRGYINLQLHFKKRESRRAIKIFASHMSGGAPKNDMGKLKAQSEYEIADVVMGAHTHSLCGEVEARRTVNHFGEIVRKPRLLVRTGNLMAAERENRDDYTDIKDYGAKPRGFTVLWLTPIINSGNILVRASIELFSTETI